MEQLVVALKVKFISTSSQKYLPLLSENTYPRKDLYMVMYSSVIHKGQTQGAIQISKN